jgi:hypothetical protein
MRTLCRFSPPIAIVGLSCSHAILKKLTEHCLLDLRIVEKARKGERHCISAVAFMVAGGGFEPPTFGLCDLTHLSMRVGLYLHPRGMLAIQSLRFLPPVRGLGSVLPYRSRDVDSTDFDE